MIPLPEQTTSPRLESGPRRPITEVAAPEPRSGPSPSIAPEPSAEFAARAREQERQRQQLLIAERKRQEALKLAEQLHEEDNAQLSEQARRDATSLQDDLQRRNKESRAREAASSKARQLADAQSSAAAQSQIESYMAQISQKIRSKVVMPPDLVGNPEATYRVELVSDGEVVRTRLRKSSGQPAYDAAVERAIHAAQPLPVPLDGALFREYFADFLLNFRPLE